MNKQLYLIALVPSGNLREEVRKLKLEMSRRFNASHALKVPAHITLQMPFRRDESNLTDELQRFASARPSFNVVVNGFDVFPPRVLFLKIVDNQPIQELHKALNYHLKSHLHFSKKELNDEIHPHMTIATRDLAKKMFHKAWPEFKERKFKASFSADRLHLLKHNGKQWELFKEFAFGET